MKPRCTIHSGHLGRLVEVEVAHIWGTLYYVVYRCEECGCKVYRHETRVEAKRRAG